jgi:UDP-glucuronate decarboxylase
VELTGSKSGIDYRPLPDDDPKQRCPDISLAKKTMKWSPTIELREGLSRTIPYFQKLLG